MSPEKSPECWDTVCCGGGARVALFEWMFSWMFEEKRTLAVEGVRFSTVQL